MSDGGSRGRKSEGPQPHGGQMRGECELEGGRAWTRIAGAGGRERQGESQGEWGILIWL